MKYTSFFLCQERAGNQKSITLPSFPKNTYKILYSYYTSNYIVNKSTFATRIALATTVTKCPFWDTFDPKSIRFLQIDKIRLIAYCLNTTMPTTSSIKKTCSGTRNCSSIRNKRVLTYAMNASHTLKAIV
jgi:hypothetical protein